MNLFNKSHNDDWDFVKANTQYHIHGIHPYPARMIPQIADKLLNIYAKNYKKKPLVLDPFCGSGTVLVESSLHNYKSIGLDNNPFAVLLSKVKSFPYNTSNLFENEKDLKKRIKKLDKKSSKIYIPKFKTLKHWFKEYVIIELASIKKLIESVDDIVLKRVLIIAFSNTVMKSSNVDWGSSYYTRTFPQEKLEKHKPNVFQIFKNEITVIHKRIRLFTNFSKGKYKPLVIRCDARNVPLYKNSVDLIITSPPYGEERNTIPYIRWSKLMLLWIGIENEEISSIESESLGGNYNTQIFKNEIPSPTFWKAIQSVDEKRINEALPFAKDYLITLKEMYRVLKRNGRSCIVIGNRSISRNLLDMAKVTQEFGTEIGFKTDTIFKRRIPKKVIAWDGPTGKTIDEESIIILKKG